MHAVHHHDVDLDNSGFHAGRLMDSLGLRPEHLRRPSMAVLTRVSVHGFDESSMVDSTVAVILCHDGSNWACLGNDNHRDAPLLLLLIHCGAHCLHPHEE